MTCPRVRRSSALTVARVPRNQNAGPSSGPGRYGSAAVERPRRHPAIDAVWLLDGPRHHLARVTRRGWTDAAAFDAWPSGQLRAALLPPDTR